MVLQLAGIRNIVLTGVTTDVCVHTTMRDANDRGYECLILSDCTGATDPGNHAAALKMVTMQVNLLFMPEFFTTFLRGQFFAALVMVTMQVTLFYS